MDLLFLGTGGAWGLPELNCDCMVCREMRQKGERRGRTGFLLSGETNLLIDCGPDIASQLSRHGIDRVDGVLITHEHGDHYMGLDELFSFKRTRPRGEFEPIPVFLTEKTWEVVTVRFGYLEAMEVIKFHRVEPNRYYPLKEFEFFPFKTYHGPFASGSVGYILKMRSENGRSTRVAYTSDFFDVPEPPPELIEPDHLIIQSFWLNEPVKNIPHHMSFQKAVGFIRQWKPKKGTYLVHLGDSDRIDGDPANAMMKKSKPLDPLKPPKGGEPYPIPLNQEQWQRTVDQIVGDFHLPFEVTVPYDGLRVSI